MLLLLLLLSFLRLLSAKHLIGSIYVASYVDVKVIDDVDIGNDHQTAIAARRTFNEWRHTMKSVMFFTLLLV